MIIIINSYVFDVLKLWICELFKREEAEEKTTKKKSFSDNAESVKR